MLEKLKTLGRTLTHGQTDDLQDLLNRAAQAACELTGADCAVIYPYDPFKRKSYVKKVIGKYGLQQPAFEVIDKPREAGLAALVREAGQIIVNSVSSGHQMLDWQEPELPKASKELAIEKIRESKFIARENVKAFVGFSLVAGAKQMRGPIELPEQVGVLFINFRSAHYFTTEELTIIEILGYQVANAIHNVRLLDRERRLRENAEILREVSRAVSTSLDLEDVAEKVLDKIAAIIKYRKASIQIIHPDDTREIIARRGFSRDEEKSRLFRPISEDALIQRVIGGKSPLILNDTSKDPDWEQEYTPNILAWVCFPLIYENETIGLITLDHDKVGHFADIDEDLLELLASLLACAIGKARIYKESQHRFELLRALQKISLEINRKRDLKELVPTIMSQAVALIAGQEHQGIEALFWQCDHAAQESTIKFGSHPDVIGLQLKFGEGLLGRIIASGHAEFVNDYVKKKSDIAPFTPTGSAQSIKHLVNVPIIINDEVAAVLTISDSVGQRSFNNNDIELLEQFTGLAAIAIENARLVTEADRRIRDLTITNEVIEAINVNYDRASLFNEVVSQVRSHFACDQCTLFLWADRGQTLIPEVAQPVLLNQQFKSGEGIVGWVHKLGQSTLVSNTTLDNRFVGHQTEKTDVARSMLAVPIKIGDQVVGVLSADKNQPYFFTHEDQSLLETLLSQIGYAIQQIDAVDLITKINASIAAEITLNDLLQQVVQGAVELINVSSGVLHLLDEDRLNIQASVTYPPEFEHPAPRFNRKEGLTYQIVQEGSLLTVHREEAAAQFHPSLPEQVESMIGIPLDIDQQAIGVLFLNDYDRHEFTAAEQSLLITLTSQAAVAIQNARLFEQVQEAEIDRMQALSQLSDRLISIEQEDLDQKINYLPGVKQ